ncbi:MAG: DUF4012 domain-containing protein [Candidatus Woesebacteria bacterium]|nr:DUF4012 domain-containing protein [Candidatus Woesebacteria bacterium]
MKMARGILDGRPDEFGRYYPVVRRCTNGLPFMGKLDKILNGTYLVLLQNNTELRATGGFPGTYARVTFENGVLKSMSVQDLYQPDGQLLGHVEPPYPIQEAFLQGWFKLRDANWDPDYTSAAATMDWFFERGGETKVDGIAAVNLGLLTRWLEIMGPVRVMPFNETVNAKNLYSLAQTYAETRVYENVTLKREFIGAAGEALWERTKTAGWIELLKLGSLIVDQLNKKQILVWTKDQETQKDVTNIHWDGGLTSGWDGSGDYLYVVDSNLGANKADCCITRQVKLDIEKNGNESHGTIYLKWQNENESQGTGPVFWGGVYNDYVRVVLPKSSVNVLKVKVGNKVLREATAEDFSTPNSLRQNKSLDIYVVEDRSNQAETESLQIVGFWLPTIDMGNTETAEIELVSKRNPPGNYKVWVKRQPGVDNLDFQVLGNGKILVNEKIPADKSYIWGL